MDAALFGVVAGAFGALGAVAAVAVAWYAALVAKRAATAQQRVAAHAAVAEWRRDLRAWAAEAVDALAEAAYTCACHDAAERDCADVLRGCRHRISSLADRGRFFLPNQDAEAFGHEKPTAYRGWRHAALDPLVAADRILSGEVGSGRFATRQAALVELRREFVSGVQRILGPEGHNREVARMIRESHEPHASDPTLGGLLTDGAAIPTGADRLINGPAAVTSP